MERFEDIQPLFQQSSLSQRSVSEDVMVFSQQFSNLFEDKSHRKTQNKIMSACYQIFLKLSKEINLQQYLSPYQLPPGKQPTLKDYSPLCCYLYKVQNSPKGFAAPIIYHKSIQEMTLIFRKEMDITWEKMSSQAKCTYTAAVKKNKEYFKAGHSQYVATQKQNQQRSLYELNVLSLFFKTNKSLAKLAKVVKMEPIINKSTIKLYFNLQDTEYDKYWKRFESFTCELAYDYVKQFKQFIVLACLVDLKYRIGNFVARNKVKQEISEPEYPIFFNKINNFFEDNDDDQFKYLFSQLIFCTNGDNFSKRSLILKQKVIDQMTDVTKLSSMEERKTLFLHIKITNNISLNSLHQVYRSLLVQNNTANQIPQNQLKHTLQNVEWIHAKMKRFPKSLNNIVYHPGSSKKHYKNHFIFRLVLKVLKRRAKILKEVQYYQLLIRDELNIKPIFVSLHQISYKSTKQINYASSKSASASFQVDKTYHLIIISSKKKILACLLMQDLKTEDLFEIVDKYFKQKGIRGVSLILLENFYRPLAISLYHNFICHYFERTYDTNIYISNKCRQYLYHQYHQQQLKLFTVFKALKGFFLKLYIKKLGHLEGSFGRILIIIKQINDCSINLPR